MRWLPFLLAGCAATPAPPPQAPPRKAAKPPPEPFWTKRAPEPEDGPLVTLATEHTFYMLATEDFGHECRAWRVEQSKQPGDDTAFLVDDNYGDVERIAFKNHGARLELVGRTRTTKFATESTACTGTFSVLELPDGSLDVSGAHWFATRDACDRALADKARVATDLSSCSWKPAANLQQQAASQRKFEAIARFGGTLFGIAGDACKPVRADPDRDNTAGSFAGFFWSDLRDGKRRGKSGYGYMLEANATSISLLGPHSSWSDGSGFGMLCGDDHVLAYGKDTVELAQTMYLSATSCRAALAKERARRARLPSTNRDANGDDAREISAFATPHLGGC